MRKVIALTLLSIAGGDLFLNADAASASPIVALGASNTEGRGRGPNADGVPREQAFPAQLEKLLAARGCNRSVANEGVAGDTTSGMLARLPGALAADTKVLILQPGGNDERKGLDLDEHKKNIAAIRDYAREHGVKVIMLDHPGQISGGDREPDRMHFSEEGHKKFAAYLLPKVLATGVCK